MRLIPLKQAQLSASWGYLIISQQARQAIKFYSLMV